MQSSVEQLIEELVENLVRIMEADLENGKVGSRTTSLTEHVTPVGLLMLNSGHRMSIALKASEKAQKNNMAAFVEYDGEGAFILHYPSIETPQPRRPKR